jgi:hypothetical protein
LIVAGGGGGGADCGGGGGGGGYQTGSSLTLDTNSIYTVSVGGGGTGAPTFGLAGGVGTISLLVSFIRLVLNHYTNTHHFGFESAIWYWHFVDVVWLFLFITVYWWGGISS